MKLLMDIKRIHERLVVVEEILKDADAGGPTKKSSPPEVAAHEENEEEDFDKNVFYIVPHISQDFKTIEGQSVQIPQLVEIFSLWTDSLYTASMLNRPKLIQHKRLRAHLWSNLEICQSLLAAVQAHIRK